MKKLNFLKGLSAMVSGLAILAAVSCTPLPPYPPQGASNGFGPRTSPSNDRGNFGSGSSTRSDSSINRSIPQHNPIPAPNNSRPYTPPAQRPSYQPPAPKLPNPPARTSTGNYPMATPSIKANTVISPYAPYNVLDTTGASSGDKLCDPSTIPVDPSTGKQYVTSSGHPDVKRGKYFIVP